MGEEQTTEARGMVPAIRDDLLLALGKMTANFAMLEFRVSTSIWSLVGGGFPRTGQIVTAGLSFKQLVNIFHALVVERAGDNSDVINKAGEFRKRLFEAEQQRNTLTHSFWAAGPGGQSTRIKDSVVKGEWKLSVKRHSADEISRLADEFGALAFEIFDFLFFRAARSEAEKDGS